MRRIRQSRKTRRLAVVALAVVMALPAQNAWAAHKLVREQFGSFPMEPTALAGEATARINDLSISRDSGNSDNDFNDGRRHHDNDRDDFNDHDDDGHGDGDDHNGDGHNGDGDDHNGDGHNGDGDDHDGGGDHNGNGDGHNGGGADHNSHRGTPPGGHGLSLLQGDSTSDHRNVSGRISASGLEDPQRLVAFLVDNEGGRAIRLGDLTEGGSTQLELRFSVAADNLQDFDRIVITREPENDTDPNPSPEVLFQKELPHE